MEGEPAAVRWRLHRRHSLRVCRALSLGSAILSLLLCVGVCVLWVRARTGTDSLVYTHDRWLPDKTVASTRAEWVSDDRRLWFEFAQGRSPPYTGNLATGYFMNADASGGRPTVRVNRTGPATQLMFGSIWISSDDRTSGCGPIRWQIFHRRPPAAMDDYRFVRLGVAHWLVAMLLLVWPCRWIVHYRRARRAAHIGLCPECGYDLRASPERCPECGHAPDDPTTRTAPLR